MAWDTTPTHSDNFNDNSLGASWTVKVGSYSETSQSLKCTSTGAILYDISTGTADYVVEFDWDFDNRTDWIFVVGRWDGTVSGSDVRGCYFFYIQKSGATWDLYLYYRDSSGGQSLLGQSTGQSITGVKKARLEMLGNSIKAVLDTTVKISATDNSITTERDAGCRMLTNMITDNFAIYKQAAAGGASPISNTFMTTNSKFFGM